MSDISSVVNTTPIIGKIIEQGALVAFMLLVIIGLCVMLRYYILKHSSLTESVLSAYTDNTRVMSEFKEVIRNVRKD